MAKKKSEDVIALETAQVEEQVAVEKIENSEQENIPSMVSAEWSDYVMKQFAEDEIFDGMPTVDGLRRVAEMLVGDIVNSQAKSVACPGGARDNKSATVEFTVTFVTPEGTPKTYTEVADVTIANTDQEFANYPSATASTRAEGRALRKALKLKRVVAAEEVKEVEEAGEDANKKIRESQVNFIKILCRQNNINVKKFVNNGTVQYKQLKDVPYNEAVKLLEKLSEYKRIQSTIPPAIKGWSDD